MHWLLFVVVLLGMSSGALAQESRVGDIVITHCWARTSRATPTEAAVYLTAVDLGAAADRLVSASSPVAEQAELHLQWHPEHDPAVAALPVERGEPFASWSSALQVIPGQPTVLQPGGMHIMLIGVRQPLSQIPTFPLSLTFEHAGTVEIPCTVDKTSPPAGSADH